MPAFPALLITARLRHNVSQAELARQIGVSAATVASWETGRRNPRPAARQRIIEAADILAITAADLNLMFAELGFSPVPAGRLVPLLDRRKRLTVIQSEIQTYAWPTLAMNEDFEVVAWNAASNDLSELDFATDLAEPGARNLLRMALSDHFNKKLLNWEEVIRVMVSLWKTNGFDPLAPGTGTPYFTNLMNYVVENHSRELEKLFEYWQSTEPHVEGTRTVFDTHWRAEDGSLLKLHSEMTTWSDYDGVTAFDWHPGNAATWDWLAARREARMASAASGEVKRELSSARALLRLARERNGFSRRQLAERAGLSEGFLYAMEAGKRPLVRETIVAATRAMKLDTAFSNAILEAAGFDPEPSDLTAYILGYDLSPDSRFAGNLEQRTTWEPAAVAREIGGYVWPALVVDGRCEVFAMNAPAFEVFGVDLAAIPPGLGRNLFALVTDEPFVRRASNWEGVIANVFPGNLEVYDAPAESVAIPGKEPDYFNSVVQHVRNREAAAGWGDAIVRKAFDVWRAKADRRRTARVAFPFACVTTTRGELRFNAIISPWNGMMDPYWSIELHPADGDTWRRIS